MNTFPSPPLESEETGKLEPVYLQVASWMKQQREKHGFSQSEISRLLGYARPTYHLIETGQQRIHLHTYEAIRNILDDAKVEETRKRLTDVEANSQSIPTWVRAEPVEALVIQEAEPTIRPVPRSWDAVELGTKLRSEYEGGVGIAALAKKHHFPRRHIIYALNVAGVPLRKYQIPPKATLHRDGEIARLYISGRTLADIGLAYGISAERVRQILERANVPRVFRPRPRRPLSSREKAALADVKAGVPRKVIKEKHGFPDWKINNLRKRLNEDN